MPSEEIPGGIPDSSWKPVAVRAEDRGERQFLAAIREKMPVFVKELIAGGVAGGLAKTAVAPLERVKILLQTRREDFLSLGVWGSALKIVRTEGVLGLYKGNGASVARIVPYAALHFMAYEQYRRWILEFFPNTNRGPVLDLIAGSLAGGTAVLCTYPLDLVRTTLAYQVSGPSTTGVLNRVGSSSIEPVYRGIIGTILKIYKDGGVRGLYRGVAPTLYGIFPYAGLKFYFYEEMKSRVPKEHRKNVAVKLGCGAIAGLLGQTITYPLDVVRRQMQVELLSQPPTNVRVDKGTLESLIKIIQEQGWRQLFSGLSINYIKVAPSVAIGFTVYDGMKSWLRVPPREEVAAPIVLEGRERETSSLHS